MARYIVTIINDTGATDIVGIVPTQKVRSIERAHGYVSVITHDGIVVTGYDLELDHSDEEENQ